MSGVLHYAALLALVTGCGPGSAEPCVPAGERVPAGVYGGLHYELTVTNGGAAVLLGDCSRATMAEVPVVDGAVHWLLTWQSGYGLPVQDTAAIEYIDVALDGAYCGGALTGTLTFPDGATGEVDVVSGRRAEIYACL